LFGKGINADKVITYAASFGATTLDKLQLLGVKEEVEGLLKQLDCISVRDGNSAEVVRALIGNDPLRHVDPVLIFDYTRYMPSKVKKTGYVIVYTYPGRITDRKEIDAIRRFARTKRLKLISIGHYFPWCDEVVVPTPFEVLAYFRDASYIVTDTFHGSVFSIKYNKPFCTIVRNMNNQKLSYLLQQFDLETRIANDVSRLPLILDTPIDYTSVNKIIETERKKSIQYLTTQLS
ncbi:polysaccharide pyruvyl transferase family protein, partial [uncultured Phocaeicola sp.]|uniref:polysaccharide pyruvyl transferase family protein n=1 Tax=uncultured Phocaeicola sp. TaxID=990718 RepID=UPI0025F3A6CF